MKHFVTLLIALSCSALHAQVINGYARVTLITGNELTVSNVNETGDTFEDGEYVLIMQMQDDVIGTTTNVASFGDLGSIQSAGLYEIKQIVSHTESAGLPATITVSGMNNTYNIGANTSVQVITFPQLGSPDFTTTSNMSALDWDGNVGGVVAFEVTGTLTLAHSITANGAGFRGGARSANYFSGGTGCSTTEYIRTTNHTRSGAKGEGIYRTATTDYLYSRGSLLNGGGGGSERINCGGGGGGNFEQGGEAGPGWSCAGPGGGGLGGISLSAQISASRIFMGGGGGGGQMNNSNATNGGDGGGIVLIKANEITTTGACGGINISANGVSVGTSGNDGQGGGGAAGSIVIQVNTWNIGAGCPVTIAANGGNGGSVNTSTHAGGGAGSQGVVIYSISEPSTNTTTTTNNGTPGCNNNSSPCTNSAGSATGANNNGILDNQTGPLPVELLYFDAIKEGTRNVICQWATASETNNSHFNIERSFNGWQWVEIGRVQGNGTSVQRNDYSFPDQNVTAGNWYYRLVQYDFDGTATHSKVAIVNFAEASQTLLYPNPVDNLLHIVSGELEHYETAEIIDATGRSISLYLLDKESTSYDVPLHELPSGVYFIRLKSSNGTILNRKFHKK
jgi:hypothetical protein